MDGPVSNESTWRRMRSAGRPCRSRRAFPGRWRVDKPAGEHDHARQDPKTGIPEATRVCSGSARPKISASFQIVVDWPQG
jgi:hypothetical protein